MESGIVPERRLPDSANKSNNVKAKRLVGSVPESWLLVKTNWVNICKESNALGNDPVRLHPEMVLQIQ